MAPSSRHSNCEDLLRQLRQLVQSRSQARASLPDGAGTSATQPNELRAVGPDRYDCSVPTSTVTAPAFGMGIYSFPQAARILGLRASDVRAGALRRWVTGLAPPSVGIGPDEPRLLSFHDLVSLEVVRRFRRSGESLQRLRKLQVALAESMPGVARPFAQRLFYTDGAAIWADLAMAGAEPQVIELVGRRAGHYVWLPVIETFAEEIRFGVGDEAVAWELTDRIEIDPNIQFGEPVVKGTRLPIAVIARELVSHSIEQIADWHAIDVEDVREVQLLLAG